ncbi:restriction endonuclease [Anaeromyxobacter sp. SG66]|uniref:restriction endonuclease n=1 Tax=Anaeromyxobacter sp. SG66 TaxID=2925410 RepID=UPI001F57040B|nr:restriction endonuclease [Anaeromyxobacter sp. SG66]
MGELVRKLFEILIDHPEGMAAKDALAATANAVTMTEWERGAYANGARRFEKNVRFATVDTVKAGWLVKTKGTWVVTDAGKAAFKKHRDPEQFYREAVRLYREWKKAQPSEGGGDDAEETDGPPDAERAVIESFEEAEEAAWRGIENLLQKMPPYDFQELVAGLIRAMGYHVDWIAPPGKDGGVDILAFTDPLGTKPPRVKVQVKRVDRKIDVADLRSFLAVLGEGDVGLFVNTGGFTRDAQDEARKQEKRRVSLLDMEKLFDLWVEHYGRLDESAKRRMPLKSVRFLAPAE